VIGILASRIKDKLHRPTFAFARGEDGELKGSGRSIPGLHLRDALDLVAKRQPGLLLRFGGHAMAAGHEVQRHAPALGESQRQHQPGRPALAPTAKVARQQAGLAQRPGQRGGRQQRQTDELESARPHRST
jgi:hypothetical protein